MIDEAPAPRVPSLWQNLDYLILWSGQIVSSFGSSISGITVPLLVLAVTHSPAQAGLVAGVGALPYPIFGLVAGALVDRWDRKTVMVVCALASGVATGSVGAAVLLGHLTIVQLYVVGLFNGTLFVFSSLAEMAAIPSVVTKEQLPTAFAQNQAVGSVAGLTGPPLGGALFQTARAVPFLADGVSFLLSAVSLLFVRARFQQERATVRRNLRLEITEGLRWLWGQHLLRMLAFLVAGINFLFAGAELIIIVLARSQHAPPVVIGGIFALASIGGLAGSAVGPRVQRKFSFRAAIVGVIALDALSWPLYLIAGNAVLLGLVTAVTFLLTPVFNVVGVSYRAAVIPDALQGRVLGAFRVVVWGVLPLGAALAGISLQRLGVRPTVLIVSIALALLALSAAASRSIREAPPLSAVEPG